MKLLQRVRISKSDSGPSMIGNKRAMVPKDPKKFSIGDKNDEKDAVTDDDEKKDSKAAVGLKRGKPGGISGLGNSLKKKTAV